MTESILDSTKKVLGIDAEYTAFDPDITMFINMAFAKLNQLGVGPEDGFSIQDKTTNWTDYLNGDETLNDVQAYVWLSVRLLFDPPQTAYLNTAFQAQLDELGWRINARREERDHPYTRTQLLGRSWLVDAPIEEVDFG